MKIIKNLTFATLAATLLFQTPSMRADDGSDRGSQGDDKNRRNHDRRIDKQFVILLAGVYKPVTVGHGPKSNLGLTGVNLSDGSWSKVKIFPVSGFPGNKDEDKAVGAFYVQLASADGIVAYDLPGGSIKAHFVGADVEQLPAEPVPPGVSWTLDGTFKLEILEATGIYQYFLGGHIHMVDILNFRAGDGTFLENCFCTIHPKLVAP